MLRNVVKRGLMYLFRLLLLSTGEQDYSKSYARFVGNFFRWVGLWTRHYGSDFRGDSDKDPGYKTLELGLFDSLSASNFYLGITSFSRDAFKRTFGIGKRILFNCSDGLHSLYAFWLAVPLLLQTSRRCGVVCWRVVVDSDCIDDHCVDDERRGLESLRCCCCCVSSRMSAPFMSRCIILILINAAITVIVVVTVFFRLQNTKWPTTLHFWNNVMLLLISNRNNRGIKFRTNTTHFRSLYFEPYLSNK